MKLSRDWGVWSGWMGYALLGLIITHAVSFFALEQVPLNVVGLLVIGGLTLLATIKRIEYGLLIALLEVSVGGHGLLFSLDIGGFLFTLRMMIFGAVILGTLVWWWKGARPRILLQRDLGWVIWVVAIGFATMLGLVVNSAIGAFDDANSYFAIGYLLPVAMIVNTKEWRRSVMMVLFVATVWLGLSAMALEYAFMRLNGESIQMLYAFVRDVRLYEVSLLIVEQMNGPAREIGEVLAGQSGYLYRIFGQSQLIALLSLVIVLSAGVIGFDKQSMPRGSVLLLIASLITLLIGQSRTFLLVGSVIGVLFCIVSIIKKRKQIFTVLQRLMMGGLAVLGVGFMIMTSLQFPWPSITTLDELNARERDTSRDVAVTSRWNLVNPMMKEILASPIIGRGFGMEVTYKSDDPRVVEATGDGTYTTYRFEWGYLDLWLKMGILGVIAPLILLFSAVKATWISYSKKPNAWFTLGLFATVLSLYGVHMLTPYLNHPIGLLWLIVLLSLIDFQVLKPISIHLRNPLPALPKTRRAESCECG